MSTKFYELDIQNIIYKKNSLNRFYKNVNNKDETETDERRQLVHSRLRKPIQYNKIRTELDNLKKELRQISILKNSIQILETVFERTPQCILQLAFLFCSLENSRLKLLLRNSLQKHLGLESLAVVFVLLFGTTFWSINKSLLDFR